MRGNIWRKRIDWDPPIVIFSYVEAAEFVPGYTLEEKAICYGVTGGIVKAANFPCTGLCS